MDVVSTPMPQSPPKKRRLTPRALNYLSSYKCMVFGNLAGRRCRTCSWDAQLADDIVEAKDTWFSIEPRRTERWGSPLVMKLGLPPASMRALHKFSHSFR